MANECGLTSKVENQRFFKIEIGTKSDMRESHICNGVCRSFWGRQINALCAVKRREPCHEGVRKSISVNVNIIISEVILRQFHTFLVNSYSHSFLSAIKFSNVYTNRKLYLRLSNVLMIKDQHCDGPDHTNSEYIT